MVIAPPRQGGSGLAAPGPTFDDPLGMLLACHDRMRRQLGTLSRLAQHLPAQGLTADARTAANNILRYFDRSATDHHADEEVSVVPRLLARAPELTALAGSIAAEHRMLEGHWRKLRPLLSSVAAGINPGLPTRLVHGMCDGYERHLAREERNLIPRARECLDEAAIGEIGAEFEARRNKDR